MTRDQQKNNRRSAWRSGARFFAHDDYVSVRDLASEIEALTHRRGGLARRRIRAVAEEIQQMAALCVGEASS